MDGNKRLMIQPPDVILNQELSQVMGSGQPFLPQMQDEAWMKYIIEFNLPNDLKQMLISYLKPLVDLAPKSNIRRKEIPMHLIQYDLIWDRYFIYMKKGKYDPNLLVVQEIIRHAIELQLNRSVDGWLGRLMHTRLFRIFQTSDDKSQMARKIGWLRGNSKQNKENTGE